MKLFNYRTLRGVSLNQIMPEHGLLILPHYLRPARKEEIVTLLVNIVSEVRRGSCPILVEAETEMLDFLKQAAWVNDTILRFRVEEREDWDNLAEAFLDLRRSVVIVDVIQKGITLEYGLPNQLKSGVVDAIRRALLEKRVEHPSLSLKKCAEAINFASRRFDDPIDAINYISLFCHFTINGDSHERALRRSYVETIIPYFETLSTQPNHWKLFFTFIAYKGKLDQIQQKLELDTDEFNQIVDELSDKLYLRRREDDGNAFLLPPFNLLNEEEYWITFNSFLSSRSELSEPYQQVAEFTAEITRRFRPFKEIPVTLPKPAMTSPIESDLLAKLLDTLEDVGLHSLKEKLASVVWNAETEAMINETLKQESDSDKRSLILLCKVFSLMKQERWLDAERALMNTTWSRNFFPQIELLLLRFFRIFASAFGRLGYPELVEEYRSKAASHERTIPADEAISLLFYDLAEKLSDDEITEADALEEIEKQKDQLSSSVIETLIDKVAELFDDNLLLAHHLAKLTYESAKLLEDENLIARVASVLAASYTDMKEFDTAVSLYSESLEFFKSQNEQAIVLILLGGLGNVYYRTNQLDKAIDSLQEALKISLEIEDKQNEVKQLYNLGVAYRDSGDSSQSLDYLNQTLQLSQEIGERGYEGLALFQLGTVYHNNLLQYDRAIELGQKALKIIRELQDRGNENALLANLGVGYRNLGQLEEAINYSRQALALSQEIGHQPDIANQYANLGNVYQDLGQLESAVERYQDALKINREIQNRQGESQNLESLGDVYHKLDRFESAVESYQKALEISRELSDRWAEGKHLNSVGLAYKGLEQWETTIEYHRQALDIFKEMGDQTNEAVCLSNLGIAYQNLGQFETAIKHHQQALEIYEEIEDRANECQQLTSLADAYLETEKPEKAVEYGQRALDIAQESGNRETEAAILNALADTYRDLKQISQAIDHYEQLLTISRELGDIDLEKSAQDNLAVLSDKTERNTK